MLKTEEIVINTGPLIALIAGLGSLAVLGSLYKRVIVPFEVVSEIEKGGLYGFGIDEFNADRFITKMKAPIDISPFLQNSLDVGEASVIQLALNNGIGTVCIDESMGRRVARLNGLNLTGSIGILIRAKKEGHHFSIAEAIQKMRNQGIYISQTIVDYAMNEVKE